MDDQEFRDRIKIGVKSPSDEFTEKIMREITSIQNEVPFENKWLIRIIIFGCCLIFFISIFVRLPHIEFFQYSIGFSPVIMPIASLIFVFILLHQVYDLKTGILNGNSNNVDQHTI
jgi:hypothetical protein